MPIYRYRCETCHHEAELVQSIKEGDEYRESKPKCPKCAAQTWTRLISLGNFVLQGGGWFRNGY